MLQGLIPVQSLKSLHDEEMKLAAEKQRTPTITSLAAHVRTRWEKARDAKRQDVEPRLLSNMRRRRGEYDPDKLTEIRKMGGSEIYMMITSTKCRAAAGWLRDSLMGTGVDKPWTLAATPMPDLPPDVVGTLQQQMASAIAPLIAQGQMVPPEVLAQQAQVMKEAAFQDLVEQANKRVDRMEQKMEDQLLEGGLSSALHQFIDDVVTFPTAFIKGPVPRKRKKMQWSPETSLLEPTDVIVLEWERVSPFDVYPAPWADSVNAGYFIERHRLTRADLEAMIGVEGYDDSAIKSALLEADETGLSDWTSNNATDSDRLMAEGKTEVLHDSELIEAIQLWDYIPGKLLAEWGLEGLSEDDPSKAYPCEIWLINNTIIKAMLNYDPLGRKPYYMASYERVPGSIWGNSVVDLVADSQDMCNAAARALSNNMGIASGPQVGVDVSRLPPGEPITQMFPWKIHQFVASDYQSSQPPITFFQPNSNAQELMAVFERFATRADEDSGIPRYMQGEHTPGVGRTSSGLSMLISNASKALKAVIANVDAGVLTPLLERLYEHNMRYSADPDLIGDVNIVARGALSLVAKEAAAVRRAEFLQMILQSPVAQQVVGVQGVGELLREGARMLDMNPNKIVMTREQIDQMLQQQQMMQQQMMQMQAAQAQASPPGAKPKALLPDGSVAGGREGSQMVNQVSGANG